MVAQAFASDEDDQPVMPTNPEIVTAAMLAVLGAFEDLVQTLGDYHGKDPHQAPLTVRRRTVAVLDRQRTWRQQAQNMHASCSARAAPDPAHARASSRVGPLPLRSRVPAPDHAAPWPQAAHGAYISRA
ncbi:hypothetical protein HFP71_33185 [Streptomyces sp. ARC32]